MYKKNLLIDGLDAAKNMGALIFHAGTAEAGGRIVTSGGRVLGVTALDKNIRAAIDSAYSFVDAIHFDGAHFRRDIAARALNHV